MWVANIFLFLCWCFNPPVYQALRDSGATCYVYLSDHGESPEMEAPDCWYGPQ